MEVELYNFDDAKKTITLVGNIMLHINNEITKKYSGTVIPLIAAVIIAQSRNVLNAWRVYLLSNGGATIIEYDMKTSDDACKLQKYILDLMTKAYDLRRAEAK